MSNSISNTQPRPTSNSTSNSPSPSAPASAPPDDAKPVSALRPYLDPTGLLTDAVEKVASYKDALSAHMNSRDEIAALKDGDSMTIGYGAEVKIEGVDVEAAAEIEISKDGGKYEVKNDYKLGLGTGAESADGDISGSAGNALALSITRPAKDAKQAYELAESSKTNALLIPAAIELSVPAVGVVPGEAYRGKELYDEMKAASKVEVSYALSAEAEIKLGEKKLGGLKQAALEAGVSVEGEGTLAARYEIDENNKKTLVLEQKLKVEGAGSLSLGAAVQTKEEMTTSLELVHRETFQLPDDFDPTSLTSLDKTLSQLKAGTSTPQTELVRTDLVRGVETEATLTATGPVHASVDALLATANPLSAFAALGEMPADSVSVTGKISRRLVDSAPIEIGIKDAAKISATYEKKKLLSTTEVKSADEFYKALDKAHRDTGKVIVFGGR